MVKLTTDLFPRLISPCFSLGPRSGVSSFLSPPSVLSICLHSPNDSLLLHRRGPSIHIFGPLCFDSLFFCLYSASLVQWLPYFVGILFRATEGDNEAKWCRKWTHDLRFGRLRNWRQQIFAQVPTELGVNHTPTFSKTPIISASLFTLYILGDKFLLFLERIQ